MEIEIISIFYLFYMVLHLKLLNVCILGRSEFIDILFIIC